MFGESSRRQHQKKKIEELKEEGEEPKKQINKRHNQYNIYFYRSIPTTVGIFLHSNDQHPCIDRYLK